MDYTKKLRTQLFIQIALGLLLVGVFAIGIWFVLSGYTDIGLLLAAVVAFVATTFFSLLIATFLVQITLEPVTKLTQAILHVSPDHENDPMTSAPNLEKIQTGKELITNLALQVYQLASQESRHSPGATNTNKESIMQSINVVNHFPLPLFVLNNERRITHTSELGLAYCGLSSAKLFGSVFEDTIRLEFPSEQTLHDWFVECQQSKVTNTRFWERVRVSLPDETVKQCDVSASYNRKNPGGAEFIITLFDRTEHYGQDDESLGFVAIAVHELRTPLTMLRGYIEVLEEELEGKLDPELEDFMQKMNVAAGQLTIFVNNILNVTRIEKNQLMLHLHEVDWAKTLNAVLDDMDIRAQMNGITIERNIANNIPMVGIDTVSIYEVVANLIDNAIKYSQDSKKILVSSTIGDTGFVETTIQDYGIGMPSNVTTNLFERFYRNHQTRGKISGTGLGLYLTKAIISAHGGQVWVRSKENEGSTFGFSVIPYDQLAEELKQGDNKDIVRQSHGWVKNHSMYRR